MEQTALSDGTRMSRLWLGTVTFGSWGNADVDECVRMIHQALDAGVNVIDTAEMYCHGESEEIVGRALRDRRDAVFLATKVGRQDAGGRPRPMTKEGIVASLEASLRRLGTDHVDLYQVHRLPSDDELPVVFEALHELVGQAKIRAIGTSSVPAWRGAGRSGQLADAGLTPIVTEQAPYSIFVRVVEPEVVDTCAGLGITLVGYAPFNGGWLSGKYRLGSEVPADSRAATWPVRRDRFDTTRTEVERKLLLIEELVPMARDLGTDLIGLSLAFALSSPGLSATIVGARRPEQLSGLLEAAELRLSDTERARIDELVPPGSVIDTEDALPYHS
jgi:aryl-alcohol dehydrogenase-like predicted oxidoreductase